MYLTLVKFPVFKLVSHSRTFSSYNEIPFALQTGFSYSYTRALRNTAIKKLCQAFSEKNKKPPLATFPAASGDDPGTVYTVPYHVPSCT